MSNQVSQYRYQFNLHVSPSSTPKFEPGRTENNSTYQWWAFKLKYPSFTIRKTCSRQQVQKIFDGASLSRFLNEMIKLISPKYLGTRTPQCVKQRVNELLYSWTRELPQVIILPYNGNRKNTIPFKTQVSGFFFLHPRDEFDSLCTSPKINILFIISLHSLINSCKKSISLHSFINSCKKSNLGTELCAQSTKPQIVN